MIRVLDYDSRKHHMRAYTGSTHVSCFDTNASSCNILLASSSTATRLASLEQGPRLSGPCVSSTGRLPSWKSASLLAKTCLVCCLGSVEGGVTPAGMSVSRPLVSSTPCPAKATPRRQLVQAWPSQPGPTTKLWCSLLSPSRRDP